MRNHSNQPAHEEDFSDRASENHYPSNWAGMRDGSNSMERGFNMGSVINQMNRMNLCNVRESYNFQNTQQIVCNESAADDVRDRII